MSKKDLRKKLEIELMKIIENYLNKSNEEVAGKIRKTTYEASKTIAKKFYKTIKSEKEKQTTAIVLKKIIPATLKKVTRKVPEKITKKPVVKAAIKKK
ncbi:MAG: hypothetical protein ABI315_03245 [Bacteroidia bacterium]